GVQRTSADAGRQQAGRGQSSAGILSSLRRKKRQDGLRQGERPGHRSNFAAADQPIDYGPGDGAVPSRLGTGLSGSPAAGTGRTGRANVLAIVAKLRYILTN